MTTEELILERLTRLEEKVDRVQRMGERLEVFAAWWENAHDLGRDLSILTEPAVRKLTAELVEMETGFQLEDLFTFIKRALPGLRNLTWSMEQLENLVDWWSDMEPMLKIAVPKLIDFLDHLDQQGVFRLLNKLMAVETLQFLEKLVDIPQVLHLEECRPMGPFRMISSLRSPEGKQALGVLVVLTKALGKLKPGEEVCPMPLTGSEGEAGKAAA